MAHKAPGKSYREVVSLIGLFNTFPDDETAKAWFESRLWPDGPCGSHCGSTDVRSGIMPGSMTRRCRDCPDRQRFRMKVGRVMKGSMRGHRAWVIAVFRCLTSLKGVSGMKQHRDLGITQKAAWHLAHRLWRAFDKGGMERFAGPVEIGETFVGGRKKCGVKGRGAVGKAIVAGAKGRVTKRVSVNPMGDARATAGAPNFVPSRAVAVTVCC